MVQPSVQFISKVNCLDDRSDLWKSDLWKQLPVLIATPMTQACNSWVKWIALRINQTNKSQIDSNGNNNQSHSIKRSCNAEVTKPMVTLSINFRPKSYVPQPQLFSHSIRFCYCYDPSFILALTQIQPSQSISISSLWRRSPRCLNKPLQIEQKCLSKSLEDYLQVNAFLDSVLVEQKE